MESESIELIKKTYGLNIINHIQSREGILITAGASKSKTYILKPLNESPERKLFTYSIHKYINNHGFQNTDSILLTKNNELTIEIESKTYVLSKHSEGRQGATESKQDAMTAARLLARLHNSSEGFTTKVAAEINETVNNISSINYVKNELGRLTESFCHRSNELVRFSKLAIKRNQPFDYEYSKIARKHCGKAQEAYTALKESNYEEISNEYDKIGAICHKDFAFHNMLINENEGEYIINFDKASIDLPLFDIVDLIKRRMRKTDWDVKEALELINEYNKIRNISKNELEIAKIILAFPQKLWRIVNKYYNTRRTWCEKSCLLKLEETENESNKIEKFLKEFII